MGHKVNSSILILGLLLFEVASAQASLASRPSSVDPSLSKIRFHLTPKVYRQLKDLTGSDLQGGTIDRVATDNATLACVTQLITDVEAIHDELQSILDRSSTNPNPNPKSPVAQAWALAFEEAETQLNRINAAIEMAQDNKTIGTLVGGRDYLKGAIQRLKNNRLELRFVPDLWLKYGKASMTFSDVDTNTLTLNDDRQSAKASNVLNHPESTVDLYHCTVQLPESQGENSTGGGSQHELAADELQRLLVGQLLNALRKFLGNSQAVQSMEKHIQDAQQQQETQKTVQSIAQKTTEIASSLGDQKQQNPTSVFESFLPHKQSLAGTK